MIRRLHVWLFLCGMAACGGPPATSNSSPSWSVSTSPRFSIGEDDSKPGHELAGVSAARLHAGRVIIANMSSSELRLFDTTGALLGTVGRKGAGPGEFQGSIFIFPAPGDSLFVFDAGNLRYSLHDPAGKFLRVLPRGVDAVIQPTWLHRRTVVESNTPGQSPAWAYAVLDGMPEAAPGDPVRRAKFDDLGYLWVSDSGKTREWKVYADSAAPIGAVVLPAGFSFLQAGNNFVLGLERDSIGREIVRAYGLTRGDGSAPRTRAPDVSAPTQDSLAESALSAVLRNLIVAQELHYSGHASYTGHADSLATHPPKGSELVIMSADARHWHGILFDRRTRTTCGVSIGFPAPPGWVDGMIFCGR